MYFIPITQSAEASWTDSEDQAMFLHRRCLTLGQAALYRHYEALWNKIWSGCCSCGDRNTYRITGPEIKAVIHSRSNVGGWTSHNVVNEWQETCWWLRVQYNEAFNSKSPSFNKWLTKGLHMWHCWSGKRMWIPLSLQFDSLNWVDGFSAWSHGWQKTGGLYWLKPPCLLASFPISCQNSEKVSSPSLFSSSEPMSCSIAAGSLAFCGWSQRGDPDHYKITLSCNISYSARLSCHLMVECSSKYNWSTIFFTDTQVSWW